MRVSPYTQERLAEAAKTSQSLSEALGKLGVDPKSSRRNYIRERMKKMRIDTSHFVRETGARWTREVLEPAVAASQSVNDVLRYLGIELVGGHHTNISRRIKAYGIDTSHFTPSTRTGAMMRDIRRRRTPSEILVADSASRVPGARPKRAMTELGVVELCALCGTEPTWRGHRLPLEVDHMDGNWRNNRIENLRLLCPNCHSATDNYRGRAKGRQL
ncbi:HNH endonuclease signature motif containing protein [Streptomyces sp. NPDC050658]|uniref:HNH endonuclease signature motif containing protein n=1 Tax=unclassified Streptomyces TaxID=2593676 RepID=UPI003432BB44